MPTKSISCPARLIHQCIDSIFGVVSLQISEHGFKTALPHLEPYLSQLPRELQTLLIKMAENSTYPFILSFTLLLRRKSWNIKKGLDSSCCCIHEIFNYHPPSSTTFYLIGIRSLQNTKHYDYTCIPCRSSILDLIIPYQVLLLPF